MYMTIKSEKEIKRERMIAEINELFNKRKDKKNDN